MARYEPVTARHPSISGPATQGQYGWPGENSLDLVGYRWVLAENRGWNPREAFKAVARFAQSYIQARYPGPASW
jgi:hypothetical protein